MRRSLRPTPREWLRIGRQVIGYGIGAVAVFTLAFEIIAAVTK